MSTPGASRDALLKPPLFPKIRDYLAGAGPGQRVFVMAPYMQAGVLDDLLGAAGPGAVVVTSWRPRDLVSGSSDLEVYGVCRGRRSTLYVHDALHLKAYSVDLDSVIVASANVSERGMGLTSPMVEECATMVAGLSSEDRMYIEGILGRARHVDDRVYRAYRGWLDVQERPPPGDGLEGPDLWPPKDPFLTSSLPMTYSIDDLLDCYRSISAGRQVADPELRNCTFHDIENYSLPEGLGDEEFVRRLREAFFAHPFIRELDGMVPGPPGVRFGEVKAWVQDNCTDVPVPSRRSLTGNVQVLMSWFVDLGEGRYVKHVPGARSEMLYHVDRPSAS